MSDVAPSDAGMIGRGPLGRRRVLAGAGALGLSALVLPPTSAHASGTLELTADETQLLSNADFDEGTQHWSTTTAWEGSLPKAVIADGLLQFPGYPITVSQSVAFDPQGVTRVEARLRIRRDDPFNSGQEYALTLLGTGPFRDPPLDQIFFSARTPSSGRSSAPVEWTTVTVGFDAADYADFAELDELTVRLAGEDVNGEDFTTSGPIVDSLELFATLAS
jgi:hypothetical protein